MKAMLLTRICDLARVHSPLEPADLAVPRPGPDEVLIRVAACGVCHTELDEIEGRTPPPALPVVPGHEVVGHVEELGPSATGLRRGDRVGVAGSTARAGTAASVPPAVRTSVRSFRPRAATPTAGTPST